MLKTGLPYDIDDLEEISNNGAIVNLDNINFNGIDKDQLIKTIYIYLRNTGFDNITLNFANTEYSFKEEFLKYYLMGNIEYEIQECNETWMKILGLYYNMDFPINSILTKDEIYIFIKNNEDYIHEITQFLCSLPIFPISKLNLENDEKLDLNMEKCDELICNNSVIGIIKNIFFMDLFLVMDFKEPVYYTKIFTEENNDLFEAILKYTPFTALLYGMCQDNWDNFLTALEDHINTLKG